MPQTDHRFLGEPIGLAYLAFSEAWERFSYYGMSALLVLYMTEQLLLPGHVGHIAGFGVFRAAVEAVAGPQSPRGLASLIFGLYGGLIHLTPLVGGFLADRWLGARRTVTLGAVLLCLGHFAMALDAGFLLALTLLILGSGCVKGNISAQVGALYDRRDEAGRSRGFVIFNLGINIGATAGPLLCGLLAQLYGWHAGFAAAGALMLLALAIYLSGRRYFAIDPARAPSTRPAAGPVGQAERGRALLLTLVVAATIFSSIAYFQTGAVGQIWIRESVDLGTPLGPFPVPWFHSVDSLLTVVGVAPLLALWAWQDRRGRATGDFAKIATGAAIATVSSALLVVACLTTPADARVALAWPLACRAGMGIAFLYYWPTLLSLVSRKAPPALVSTLLGVVFLSLFVANLAMGWIGSFYDRLGPISFWSLNTAIGAVGVAATLVLARAFKRLPSWSET